jgi:endogenous inhibitor of DNA gyrase (YacG/DUF329 family)
MTNNCKDCGKESYSIAIGGQCPFCTEDEEDITDSS